MRFNPSVIIVPRMMIALVVHIKNRNLSIIVMVSRIEAPVPVIIFPGMMDIIQNDFIQ
jgi:hypothetical protein